MRFRAFSAPTVEQESSDLAKNETFCYLQYLFMYLGNKKRISKQKDVSAQYAKIAVSQSLNMDLASKASTEKAAHDSKKVHS